MTIISNNILLSPVAQMASLNTGPKLKYYKGQQDVWMHITVIHDMGIDLDKFCSAHEYITYTALQ